MDRTSYKIVFLIALFLFTLISFVPFIFVHFCNKNRNINDYQSLAMKRKRRLRKNVVSLMNCFASGVFMSVCFLDLLPEVEEKLKNFMDSSANFKGTTFPLPHFFIVVGFLLLLIIEQLANFCKKGDTHNPFHYDHGHHDADSFISSTASNVISHHAHDHHQHHDVPRVQVPTSHFLSRSANYSVTLRVDVPRTVDVNVSNLNTLHDRLTESEPLLSRNDDDDANILEEMKEEELEKAEKSTDPSAHSHFRYIMLAVVLSVHSIFEGLALGLETNISTVVQLFAAIAIHKSVVAFSLGLNMVQSGLSPCSMSISLSIFCLASPLGAIIGICVEIGTVESGWTVGLIGLLQALACGSFIYIVFFELLPHEFFTYRKHPNSFLKVLFLILGLTILSILMLFGPV